jgi:hypothetical protein
VVLAGEFAGVVVVALWTVWPVAATVPVVVSDVALPGAFAGPVVVAAVGVVDDEMSGKSSVPEVLGWRASVPVAKGPELGLRTDTT